MFHFGAKTRTFILNCFAPCNASLTKSISGTLLKKMTCHNLPVKSSFADLEYKMFPHDQNSTCNILPCTLRVHLRCTCVPSDDDMTFNINVFHVCINLSSVT